MKKVVCILLIFAMMLGLAGCFTTAGASDLMAQLTPKAPQGKSADEAFRRSQMALALKLFSATSQESQGENVLISPLSIQLALAITANGANGQTLEEMQALLGGSISLDMLNEYLTGYTAALPSEEKARLHIANSIWYRDGETPLDVKAPFLQTAMDYYKAQAYQAPFDKSTVDAINSWVNKNTDGRIKKLVDRLDSSTVMVLLNALAFDAKWQSIYSEADITRSTFTTLTGQRQDAELMYSEEYSFLEMPNATGFIKNYHKGSYKFAALLPNEGVDIYDFITNLDPVELTNVLAQPQKIMVKSWLPSFTSEYSLEMKDMLRGLGMATAFDSNAADFSRMSDTPLHITAVIHKTYIAVDENGTKAAAITGVVMDECAAMVPAQFREVRLDRPFVYMILDGQNGLPIFIGVVTEMQTN